MEIKPELRAYITSKKWAFKPAKGSPKDIAIQTCPFCGKAKWKFWIHATRALYHCWNCHAKGNLYKLKRELGDLKGVQSAAQATGQEKQQQSKPVDMAYVDKWHKNLLKSKKGRSYCKSRGFSLETIKHFKLGIQKKHGVTWLAIPHINDGVCHNVKFRSLPPADKAFRRVKGSASVLYNADALSDYTEIVIAEAELDAISFYEAGVKNVVALTCGADTLLDEWYDLLSGVEKVILALDADPVGQTGARDIARRLGFDKCVNVLLPGDDANEVLTEFGKEDLRDSLEAEEEFEVGGILHASDVLLRCKRQHEIGAEGLLTPWDDVNGIIGKGFQPGDLVVLSAKVKIGKALRHGEIVWTPTGQVNIEDVSVGDLVCGADGKGYPVTGVFPQGVVDIYRVEFSDGVTVDASKDHLWEVIKTNNNPLSESTTMSTEQILQAGVTRKWLKKYRARNFKVPMADPLELVPVESLPLDPYLIGVVIGDGCLSRVSSLVIACSSKEVRTEIARVVPSGFTLKDVDGCSFRVSTVRGSKDRSLITGALKALGLSGCKAKEKFIPTCYLQQPIKNRIRLLQGLMDTDGTMAKRGSLQFTTTSPILIDDVRELVQSLGGKGMITSKQPKIGSKVYSTTYTLNFSLPDSIVPFGFRAHKLERFRQITDKQKRKNARTIKSIKFVGRDRATCISVASPDNLFVCSHGVVTHNTTLALGEALWLAQHGVPSLVHCLEMSPERLGEKLAAILRKKPVDDLTNVDFSIARYMIKNMPLYLVEPDWSGSSSVEGVFNKIREAVKRHGIKFLVFDHLHFLCRSLKYVTQEVGQVTRGFKLLSEELKIVTWLIAQPKKVGSGKMITYDDIKDSSAIPADADWIMLMHRKPIPAALDGDLESTSSQEVLEPKTLIRFDATRFKSGGEAWLYYEGETSTFYNWKERPQENGR